MLNGKEILNHVNSWKDALYVAFDKCGLEILSHSAPLFYPQIDVTESVDIFTSHSSFLKYAVERGQFVYWDASLFSAAACGAPQMFAGRRFPALSPPCQVWILDDSATVYSYISPERSSNLILCAVILATDPKYIFTASVYKPNSDEDYSVQDLRVNIYSSHLETESDSTIQPHTEWAYICGAIEFVTQPFVESASLDRVASFSGAHHNQKRNDAKKIQIVYLRRREQHPTINGQPNPVDWSCQWLVQGHWRSQFHPSDKTHKPIFIQSYVKGPEDKPFKASAQRIYAAVR